MNWSKIIGIRLALAGVVSSLTLAAAAANGIVISLSGENDGYTGLVWNGDGEAWSTDGAGIAGTITGDGGFWLQRRLQYAFPLADIPPSFARVRISLAYWGAGNPDNLGNVWLTSIADENNPGTVDKDDFNDPAIIIGGSSEELFMASDYRPNGGIRIELDVTERVREAVKAKRDFVTFRLRNDQVELANDRQFANVEWAGYEPQLIVDEDYIHESGAFEVKDGDGEVVEGGKAAKRVIAHQNGTFDLWDSTTVPAGDEGDNTEWRGIMRFALPEIPSDEYVVGAEMAFYLSGRYNAPWTNLKVVAYSAPQDLITGADFYCEDGAVTVGEPFTPETPNGTFATVTSPEFGSLVSSELRKHHRNLGVRLQIADEDGTNGDGVAQLFEVASFYYPEENRVPVLRVFTRKKTPGMIVIIH